MSRLGVLRDQPPIGRFGFGHVRLFRQQVTLRADKQDFRSQLVLRELRVGQERFRVCSRVRIISQFQSDEACAVHGVCRSRVIGVLLSERDELRGRCLTRFRLSGQSFEPAEPHVRQKRALRVRCDSLVQGFDGVDRFGLSNQRAAEQPGSLVGTGVFSRDDLREVGRRLRKLLGAKPALPTREQRRSEVRTFRETLRQRLELVRRLRQLILSLYTQRELIQRVLGVRRSGDALHLLVQLFGVGMTLQAGQCGAVAKAALVEAFVFGELFDELIERLRRVLVLSEFRVRDAEPVIRVDGLRCLSVLLHDPIVHRNGQS